MILFVCLFFIYLFLYILGLIKDVRLFHSSYVGIANAFLNFYYLGFQIISSSYFYLQ